MENFNVEVNDKAYEVKKFNLMDVYDALDLFCDYDYKIFREIMAIWHAGDSTCVNSIIDCKHKFETCIGLVQNVEWLCDKGFSEEIKPTRLTDHSYILDIKLRNVFGTILFGCDFRDGIYPIIEIKDTDVRIPVYFLNKVRYLDCEFEYKGGTYYTKKKFVKSC